MKGDTEVLLMVFLFFAGVAFNAYLSEEVVSGILTLLVAPAATLVAAYVGARSAFAFQREYQLQAEKRRQSAALNLTIFEVARVYNVILTIEKQFISEHRDHPGRGLMIMPAAAFVVDPPTFSFSDLTFLFDSSNPNLLGELSLFEREVASTLAIIRERSKLHVDHLQPAVERLHRAHGEQFTLPQLVDELGPRYTTHLEKVTEFMIKGVDDILDACPKLSEALTKLGNELLKGERILSLKALKDREHDAARV